MEVEGDEVAQGGNRLRRIGTPGSEIQGCALGRFDRHHFDDALGVDPWTILREPNLDMRLKGLSELGQLD